MSYVFIYFLLVHWLADFVFQTDWMAKNKSTNNFALLTHIFAYSVVLLISLLTLAVFKQEDLPTTVLYFISINVLSHWLIDYVTSKVTSSLYKVGDTHNFFVVIGFDQFLHVSILFASYQYFIGPHL